MICGRGLNSKVHLLCGAIFAFVGAVTLALAIFMAMNMDELIAHGRGNVELLPLIFGLTGGIALAVGAVLLAHGRRAERLRRCLREEGTCVTAEITGFPADYSVMINGWPTYRVECSYSDPRTGKIHMFRSEPLRVDPARYVTQRTVRVYVDTKSGCQDYFVDIEPLLPDIRRH